MYRKDLLGICMEEKGDEAIYCAFINPWHNSYKSCKIKWKFMVMIKFVKAGISFLEFQKTEIVDNLEAKRIKRSCFYA
jgi:hypothetical protein